MAKAKKTTAAPKTAPEAKTISTRKKAPVTKTVKPGAKASTATKTAPAALAKKAPEVKALKPGGLEKKYLKQGSVCNVTFVLPQAAAPDAGSVCILGEFNNWSADVHPLVRREEGDFVITLELEAGRAYRFRYVIDGWKFENDWFADRYEPNPYGGEDSVVDV
jgi:1,4-alpha-glucan branching enzyme